MVVREHIGVIILAVFIVIAVLGPIVCIIYSRRREHMKFHPSPKAFRQARRKLGPVAECKRGDEKGLCGDAEWTDNCPICIASLLSPETNEEDTNSNEKAATPTAAGGRGDGEEASGSKDTTTKDEVRAERASNPGEIGGEATSTDGAGRAEAHRPRPSQAEPRSPVIKRMSTCLSLPAPLTLALRKNAGNVSSDRDAEILKLKSCGHWFHARCLSSWFLIDRYDCPVCRKTYWEGPPKRPNLNHWLQTSYSTNATRLGTGALV